MRARYRCSMPPPSCIHSLTHKLYITPYFHLQCCLRLASRQVHIASADQRGCAAWVGFAAVLRIATRRLQLPLQQVQCGQVDCCSSPLLAVSPLKLLEQAHRCGILALCQVLIGTCQLHLAGQRCIPRSCQLLATPLKAAGPAAWVQLGRNAAGGGQDVAVCLRLQQRDKQEALLADMAGHHSQKLLVGIVLRVRWTTSAPLVHAP